jgi:hypothetical protein
MNTRVLRNIALVAAIVLTVSACGGGTGGTGATGGTGGTGVSIGVMTKGSTIVNGVRFEDTTANIFIDDTPKTAAALQNGMVVKLLGTVNDDGINGTAQRVKALIEVRGTPTSVSPTANPKSLVVLGQTVFVDDQTVYSNLAGFGSITTSTLIEVHGLRDTTGRVRATRIEASAAQMGDDTVDEIRGVVSGGVAGSNPTTFNLGSQAVSVTGGVVIAPTGASYQNGSVVEVHCTVRPCAPGGVFQASRIVVEDSEDSAFRPSSGQRFEAEGLISGFTVGNPDFSVAGTPVTTTGSTRFQGGIATDLANNVKVEAEGSWNGSRLVASKIEFKRSVVRLQGVVTVSNANSFTLQIGAPAAARNVTVEVDSFTQGTVPGIGPNCVQVRGQRKVGGSLVVVAGEVDNGCSQGGDHVLQALVEAKAEPNLTLLGFSVNVTGAQFRNLIDANISQAAFFSLVSVTNPGPPSVAGTLVRVRFDRNNLSVVQEVEIED